MNPADGVVITTIRQVGHKHTKDDILAGALATAHDEGLSKLSFGRVAKRLGISDRTVVYYFPSKSDLIGEVIVSVGLELQATLALVFKTDDDTKVGGHRELVSAAWPVLATPEADPVFRLFFEANGLAAAGIEPYRALVPQLVSGWVDWVMSFLAGDGPAKRAEAEATIAVIDGLLLVRLLAGPEAGDRAAGALGIG